MSLQTTDLRYKLIKKIKDERFVEEQLDRYFLHVHFGNRDLQTCVIDPGEKRVLLVEDFILPPANSSSEWLEVLSELFDDHSLLKANFWMSITISIKNSKFALVPEELFDEASTADYLKFNASVDPASENFLFTRSKSSQAVVAFAMDKKLNTWLDDVYPQARPRYVHQSGALIEGMLQYDAFRKDMAPPLYIYIDRFKLHILYAKGGKLIYYNQFTISQFADYIKYIMLVMKFLRIDQRVSQLVLWGYIGRNSSHYHEFYRYINNVSFGGRPHGLQFGYIFDELQEHHFFDLYSINSLR